MSKEISQDDTKVRKALSIKRSCTKIQLGGLKSIIKFISKAENKFAIHRPVRRLWEQRLATKKPLGGGRQGRNDKTHNI